MGLAALLSIQTITLADRAYTLCAGCSTVVDMFRHCTSPSLAVIVNLLSLDQMVPTDWWTEYPAKARWKRYISHERLMKGRACCTS